MDDRFCGSWSQFRSRVVLDILASGWLHLTNTSSERKVDVMAKPRKLAGKQGKKPKRGLRIRDLGTQGHAADNVKGGTIYAKKLPSGIGT